MPDRHTTFTHAPEKVTYVRTDRYGRKEFAIVEGSHEYLCERAIELMRHGFKPSDEPKVTVHA